jgi:SET domain-containing protein
MTVPLETVFAFHLFTFAFSAHCLVVQCCSMKLKLADGLSIRDSPINGKGCFATIPFQRRRKIAEYTGERIPDSEAQRRALNRAKLRICDIDGRWSLDGSRGGNGTHYINHCCDPNAYMRIAYGHVMFFALRDIKAGEEITIDYEITLHPNSKRCFCGAKNCRGTINRADLI